MAIYGIKIWTRNNENEKDKGSPIITKPTMISNKKNAMSLLLEIPTLKKITPNRDFSISYRDDEGKDIFIDVNGKTFNYPQWI